MIIPPNSSFPRVLRTSAAFSLVELMVVVAIVIILMALIVPNMGGIGSARQLTGEAALLQSNLLAARRLALTRNTPVELRIYRTDSQQTPELTDSYVAYQTLIKSRDDVASSNEIFKPEGRIHRFPGRVVITDNASFTTLAKTDRQQSPDSNASAAGNSAAADLPFFAVRFFPDGSAQLGRTTSEPWSITLQSWTPGASSELPPNFVTLVVDPFNGQVTKFQPGD